MTYLISYHHLELRGVNMEAVHLCSEGEMLVLHEKDAWPRLQLFTPFSKGMWEKINYITKPLTEK